MSKKVRKVSRIDDPNIEAQIDEIIRVVNSLDARTEEADAKATVNTQPKLVFREFPSDPVFGNCEFVYDVTLRWYKAEGAVMYEIRTDLNWGNESGRVYLGSALQYSFIPGQRYYTFYIKSINPAGKYSQGYDEITLEKPVPSIPDPPETMPFFSAVKIIPAPNHEQGILGHYAYVTIEGETDKVDIPIGSSHVYNAPSGTEMTIEMSAYDILGEGGKSAPVTASTLKLSDRDIPEEIIEPSNLVKSLREDIDLTKTRAIDALAQISDLDSIVDDTIADLNAAKGRLTSAETEISNAKNRISTVETKIGEIDDEIESAKDRLTSAETEITGAKNRLDSVETEVAGAKSRLSDAEDKLGTIDVEIAGAKERISDAETDLLDAKNRLSDVEDEIVDTKDRLLGAESRLSSFDDEIADAKDRLTDAESRLTATETDLTDAKTRLTSVEESITDAEARLVDAENRLSSIDDEIADAKDRLTDAELRLTAAETDLTDARTRLIEAENDLEGLEGVVSTHETKISNVEGELSTKVSQTEFNALAGTVSTQGTILAQHADQIAMKAEQSEVDTLSEAVANNTATLEVHATQIAARVTKEVYNLLENRVEEAEAELVALADEISAKVSQTVFEDLQSRVTANEAELLVQAEAIQARVTQEVYDTLANRVTTVEGTLEVLPEQIALKASQSDVDALTGRVEDAEAELLVLATEISSKVSQTVFDSLSEAVTSQGTQITQNAAAIESKADQSVVDALSGTVAEHSTLISQTAEAIETKADKSVVDTLSDTVSSHTSTLQQHANMIAARVTTEVFNALEDRVEANEAELIVLADEISSKVSQSVFDALEQRVTTNEGTLAVHADMIAARVTSEVFDLLEERVETAEGQLTVLADEVSAKVSQTVFDALAGRVETTEGILEVLPDQINAKADQSVVDTLTERVEEAEGQLSVLATEIAARVTQTVFDELEGRVASNEGELTVLADEISSKVSQSVFDTLAGRVSEAEGQLTVLAGEIEARVKQSVFDELVGRVEDAEATLTVLPGQIAAKADKTTVQQIDDELNTVKSNVATLTTNYDGIVARVEEVEGDINSLDDEITDVKSITGQLEVRAGKIEASVSAIEEDVDDHGNRLASVENAVVEVLPGQIALKADQSEVDILTGRVEDTEATLVVLATEISSKVSQTVFDTLSETVTSQGTQITQNATAIESKADQSVVDALSGTVSNHSTLISQNATAITQKADKSTVDALTGRVSAAEATLTTHADAIEARATKEEVDAIEDRVTAAEGQLSVQAGKIEAKAEKSEVQALEEDLSAVSNQVSTLTTSYDSISARVEAVEGVTDDLTDEVSDVKSRTGSLELRADNIEASVSSLEENVDEHGNRLLDVEHAVVNVLPGQIELKANASDVYTKAQVNTELGKKADKTDVDDLTARVSNAELTINAHEGAIAQKAERTEVYTKTETDAKLGTKVDITTYNQKVGELTTSIEGISGRVENTETNIDNLTGEISSVKSDVASLNIRADGIESSVSSLDARVEGNEIQLENHASLIQQNADGILSEVTRLDGKIDGRAVVKPQGGKLWHFDTSLESTDGIKPLEGAVATLRPNEGRFGGAVAVEESTVNLLEANQRIPRSKTGWITGVANLSFPVSASLWGVEDVSNFPYADSCISVTTSGTRTEGVGQRDISGEKDTTYTLSAYVKFPAGTQFAMAIRSDAGSIVSNSTGILTSTGEWQRISVTVTSLPDTDPVWRWSVLTGNAVTFYVTAVQLEAKPFATSFVDGTRPDGILAYPIALPEDYSIACWRKSPTDTEYHHIVKHSDGTVFVDGVEDSEYDVGWIAGSDDCLMFSNQTGLIDELLILPYAATEEEIKGWYEAKGAFVDQAEINYQQSQIVQLADEISSKVSRDDFDALEDTVTAMGTVVTQTAEAVEQKAELSTVTELGDNLSQVINDVATLTTSYNSISARVESVEGDINTLTGEITGVKSRTSTLEQRAEGFDARVEAIEEDVDGLDGRISTAESNISANASAIELRATKSEVEDVSEKVTNLETWKGQFSVTPANINATVSAVNDSSTGLSAAWSEINQTPTKISQAVSSLRSDIDDAIADVYSDISQTASSINSTISSLQTNLEGQIAAGDSALSGQISAIEQTLSGITSTVEDLGGELGDISTQVTQLADRYSVKIQKTIGDKTYATGFVSGINEQNESEFAVLADKFRVFGSLDEEGDGTALFVVDAQTNKAYLNVEEVIAAGAIKAEHLEADSVLAYLVQAGFAQFDEANVLDLLVDRRIRVGDNLEIGGNRIVVGGYETVSETVWITEDVYVDGADSTAADSNYSDSTRLHFDDDVPERSLLKFNLPSGNITSATLRLYGRLGDSSPFYIRALKGDWDYQTVTWNNRPASDLVITTPTYQENEDYHWIEIDITPVIQLWKQGQQNYGIEIYYDGEAFARSSRYSNPAYHPHVVFTVSSEEKMPKAVFGDLEGLDWLDKTLPAGEHGFWGKGVRIIGDIASADKEGNYSVLSGGRLAFFRATQWDEHGNPIAHSKAMYPAQLVSGTANSGQVVDLYAQGYRFLSEPKIIVFPNFNRTYLANHQGQDVWINWKVEAVDDDTPIFNPVSGAVKFRVRVETTVKGGDDLAAENSLTRRRLQGTGQLSTAEGETGSGATSLRVKCTSYLRLRREYEDGFYYYQGHQEYWVYYRRKGTSQWKILGEHSHWDYRFGSPSGTPPIVNESKVFEVPLSPAGVYEIRVVLTTWGLYDSYVYIDAFKYRSQDTISSVDESEMVNYLVIDGG